MKNVSMREVADMAGVSTATVSHVINNTRFVAEETRQRVLDCIAQLGYNPNTMARIFKTGKKNLIGFIAPDIANTFFSCIIEGIEDVIGEKGYRLIVSNTKETQEREADSIRVLANGIVDGIIIASTMDSYNQLINLVPDNIPLVFIDRTLPDCPFDSIIISNYHAIYEAVEALINEGHTRIGYITGLQRLSTMQERLAAYRDAMSAHNIRVKPEYICMGTSMRSYADPYVEKLLSHDCTAIIVSNNVMTDDVLYYLHRHKLNDKVALIGYNDSGYHNYAFRNIRAVYQPATDLGRAAGNQILSRIADPDQPIRQITLHASFISSE